MRSKVSSVINVAHKARAKVHESNTTKERKVDRRIKSMEEDYCNEIEMLKKKLAQATFHLEPMIVHAYLI